MSVITADMSCWTEFWSRTHKRARWSFDKQLVVTYQTQTQTSINKQTAQSGREYRRHSLFLVLPFPRKKRHVERESSGVFRLTLAMAFLYLIVACWIRLCILIFPSPQGTTTRVLPKHTVTFIFARYSQRLHREARKVLNSSGRISKRRQHYIHTGKKRDKSSCCAPQVGLDHLFGVWVSSCRGWSGRGLGFGSHTHTHTYIHTHTLSLSLLQSDSQPV